LRAKSRSMECLFTPDLPKEKGKRRGGKKEGKGERGKGKGSAANLFAPHIVERKKKKGGKKGER